MLKDQFLLLVHNAIYQIKHLMLCLCVSLSLSPCRPSTPPLAITLCCFLENLSLASDESAIIIPRVPLEENHWWNDQNHGVGEQSGSLRMSSTDTKHTSERKAGSYRLNNEVMRNILGSIFADRETCGIKVLYVYIVCYRLRLNYELPNEKHMNIQYLRSQTVCNKLNGAINVFCFMLFLKTYTVLP